MLSRIISPTIGLLIALGAVFIGSKSSEIFVPNLEFAVSDQLTTEFVLRPRPDKASCEAAVSSLTNAFLSSCPTCAVQQSRCSSSLTEHEIGLLSAQTLPIPTAVFKDGVIAYKAGDPASAMSACRTAEAHAKRNGQAMQCFEPNELRLTSFALNAGRSDNQLKLAFGVLSAIVIVWLFYLALDVSNRPASDTRQSSFAGKLDRLLAGLDITAMPRNAKRAIMVGTDLILVPLSVVIAGIIHFHGNSLGSSGLIWLVAISPLIAVPYFRRLGLYRAIVRHMGSAAVAFVLIGVTATAVTLYVVDLLVINSGSHWSFFIVFWGVNLIFTGGSRFGARLYVYSMQVQRQSREAVVIYGAGHTGVELLASLATSTSFRPVAFVDDNPTLQKTIIRGLKVYPPEDIEHLTKNRAVSQVFLAMPMLSIRKRKSIVDSLERYPVHVSTVPSFSEIVSGKAQISEIREIEIEDLLGRDSVLPSKALLTKCIKGKNVMVTGAGGSIGTELCRQIIKSEPSKLVLLELSEFALYSIEHELKSVIDAQNLEIELQAIIGNVQAEDKVFQAMQANDVHTVFHAAAYKHVPLVEANISEGVLNNTFGTMRAAQAAQRAKVETFVLISTDKAVRPTNVMGASKRASELVLQAMQSHQTTTDTVFCMVRFGNVLDSSGSVVPLFRKQIKQGGPVTVTHPEITRFFMSIPEAAQLVIQAAAMAKGGEVFLLDMGEPVKIFDLASKMIHLHGFSVKDSENADGDIEITFTGLRPGEKLYEELLIGEDPIGTEHPRIMKGHEDHLTWGELEKTFVTLLKSCENNDEIAIKKTLQTIVSGFKTHIPEVDTPPSSDATDSTVVRLPSNS